MEHDVDVAHQLADQVAVADVALDDAQGPVGLRPREVVAASADEVVQDHDLAGVALDEQVAEVGADGACAAGYENAFAAQ